MKLFQISDIKKLRISPIFLGLLVSVAVLLSSCLKKGDEVVPANLSVIHAAVGQSGLDFYLDNQKVNSESMDYTEKLSYFEIYPGNRRADFAKVGGTQGIAGGTGAFEQGKYYSLFVYSKVDSTLLVLTEDDLSAPPAGKAKVRFMHFTADAPAVDVALSQTLLFSNKVFKSYTPFVNVDPATYALELRPTGSTTAKAQMDIVFEANKIYTIWTKGLWNSTDPSTALGVQVIVNK